MCNNLYPNFKRVMMIDDNSTDLYISSRIIIKNNFATEVLEYDSCKDALKYLQENQAYTQLLPEVIFVDIYMPLMSGFDFLAEFDKISSLKNYCQVHIISSTIDDNDIARARIEQNSLSFHVKPLTTEILSQIRSTSYKKS